MSRRTAETSCPRPAPFCDTEELVRDITLLEAGLAAQIRRLEQVNAPASPEFQHYRGRPVWWWRVMLVAWAWSADTERCFALDARRGLRVVLKEWPDGLLVDFVDGVLSDAAPSTAA